MTEIGRRDMLMGAGLALAAAAAATGAARAAEPPYRTATYTTPRGDAVLTIYRKTPEGAGRTPALLLAHGSSVSALPTFDLTVPGAGEYSMMNVFAHWGYDVWALDFSGYGKSTMPTGNSDIAMGSEDLLATVDLIKAQTGQSKVHLMGESGGALKCGRFAMDHPDRVNRLVLEAMTWTGAGSPTLAKRAEQAEYYKTHTTRPRDEAAILSIFTRDRPGTADPRVGPAMAAAELPHGTSIPAGTYLDMTVNLPIIDPARITVPTLVARGEYDGIATEQDLLAFMAKLATPDRQYSVIPGAAHSLSMGLARRRYWHIMHGFLSMPA
ncbi:MAG TPA: alpha/beta fold hydrolase [Aliidongia sp.]|uniref:alpha/beta hydrolase n=1 Tax=Aliidongia sp. TaxID=1914230 RepID=UPI002DDCB35C|nr:alpha/beta fold hydrolase [Aliidongia sp.]HEV2677460.1 alpha/beta fold hydrolase [Aliidongia sp.]